MTENSKSLNGGTFLKTIFSSRQVRLIRLIFLLPLFYSPSVFAWGTRGHQVICEAAVFLVDSPELQTFLRSRTLMMSHLCNVPDFSWKSKGGEAVSIGSPTHFIDPEVIGLAIRDIPLDFQKLQETYEGKADQFKADRKIFSLAKDLGSIYWRTEQFYRRCVEFGKIAASAEVPTGKDLQNNENPFNKAVYEMVTNMGLLGHFVGDAGQPFHSTADYDGYNQNHGGIHAFFEEEMVSSQDEKLLTDVVAQGHKLYDESDRPSKKKKAPAKKNAKAERYTAKMTETQFLKGDNVMERIRALSAISADEIGTIYQNDPIVTKSTVSLENGMELKTAAKRNPTEETAKKFRPIIVRELARSATLLAQYWGEIYEKSGKPKLQSYKSYRYPFEPDYVAPDYITNPKTAK